MREATRRCARLAATTARSRRAASRSSCTFGFDGAGARIANEALQLLAAPNCPTGKRDLLLMPDQMMLQIHESIGHPLELDRILGDERNFAGWSFVKPEMFGHYRYGSELLNVTFDPELREEAAAYAFDDDGTPATQALSDSRRPARASARRRAVAAARATAGRGEFARVELEPPADRPDGESEYRAGHEFARRDDRQYRTRHPDAHQYVVVDRRPSQQVPVRLRIRSTDRKRQAHPGRQAAELSRYLGEFLAQPESRSATRKHAACIGTPMCGKGEPAQIVRVGHASPACVFSDIDVFGGA